MGGSLAAETGRQEKFQMSTAQSRAAFRSDAAIAIRTVEKPETISSENESSTRFWCQKTDDTAAFYATITTRCAFYDGNWPQVPAPTVPSYS
jgi:hypothetical protein